MDSFYDVFPIQSMAKSVKSDINKGSFQSFQELSKDFERIHNGFKSIMKEYSYFYVPTYMN